MRPGWRVAFALLWWMEVAIGGARQHLCAPLTGWFAGLFWFADAEVARVRKELSTRHAASIEQLQAENDARCGKLEAELSNSVTELLDSKNVNRRLEQVCGTLHA